MCKVFETDSRVLIKKFIYLRNFWLKIFMKALLNGFGVLYCM